MQSNSVRLRAKLITTRKTFSLMRLNYWTVLRQLPFYWSLGNWFHSNPFHKYLTIQCQTHYQTCQTGNFVTLTVIKETFILVRWLFVHWMILIQMLLDYCDKHFGSVGFNPFFLLMTEFQKGISVVKIALIQNGREPIRLSSQTNNQIFWFVLIGVSAIGHLIQFDHKIGNISHFLWLLKPLIDFWILLKPVLCFEAS